MNVVDDSTASNAGQLPNFLVIGAQKCGTTWLARMGSQHPQITVADQKELHFFNKPEVFAAGLDWYQQQFQPGPQTRAIGEFTPNYFWTHSPTAEPELGGQTHDIPQLIRQNLGQIPLIVSLRNPVNRAISGYYHQLRAGRVTPQQSILEVADQYGIESMGYYDDHLERWLQHYDAKDILVLIYEQDLSDAQKAETIRKVFGHIGVDTSFVPDGMYEKFNANGSHFRMRARHSSFPFLAREKVARLLPDTVTERRRWRVDIPDDARRELALRFRPHVERLEQMLGRHCPW